MRSTRIWIAIVATLGLIVGLPAVVIAANDGGESQGTGGGGAPAEAITTSHELKRVPIDACRLVDTRLAVGIMSPGVERDIDILGSTTDYSSQGGSATGCSISSDAEAVEVTMTAVGSQGRGSVRIWPSDKPIPKAPNLTYTDLILASNTTTLPVCKTACGGVDAHTQATGLNTHLIIDAVAYFVPPMFAEVNGDGMLWNGSRVVSATRTSLGRYSVVFTRSVVGCSIQAQAGFAGDNSGIVGDQQVDIYAFNNAANPSTVIVDTEDPDAADTQVDNNFMLLVTC